MEKTKGSTTMGYIGSALGIVVQEWGVLSATLIWQQGSCSLTTKARQGFHDALCAGRLPGIPKATRGEQTHICLAALGECLYLAGFDPRCMYVFPLTGGSRAFLNRIENYTVSLCHNPSCISCYRMHSPTHYLYPPLNFLV